MDLAMVMATAYLLGAIPTSYIVVHIVTGRDIRDVGSGNAGTMNTWENVGFVSGVVVALGDIGKGMAAVGFAYWMGFDDAAAIAAALVAVLGHDYSIFLRMNGGNGTATASGALFALVPAASLPGLAAAFLLWPILHSKRRAGLIGLTMVPVLTYAEAYEPIKLIGVLLLLTVVAAKIFRFEGFTPARNRSTRPPGM